MEVTPAEKHNRTYRKAIENIKHFSRYPYVPYTEHISAKVFQNGHEPLDLTRYPETFGPKDDDPTTNLSDALNRSLSINEPTKAADEEWRATKPDMARWGKRFAQMKKMEKDRLGMVRAKMAEPYPQHLRPITSFLDKRAIRETPVIPSTKRVKAIPSKMSELYKEGGKFQIGERLASPPLQSVKLDVDEILNMKLQFPQDVIEGARTFKRGVSQVRKNAETIAAIPADENDQWVKWEKEDKMNLDRLPTYIPPPLFPRQPPADRIFRPTNLKHVGKTIKPALNDPESSLGKLIGDVAGDTTAESVVNALRLWRMSSAGDEQEDAYNVHLLDEFDEPAFLPMTPSSKASISATSPGKLAAIEYNSPQAWSAGRTRKRRAWEDDPSMEPPLMPMSHGYQNMLPTPTRTRPKIEPIDYSSPIYSSSRTGASVAATQGANRNRYQPSRPPQMYRQILSHRDEHLPSMEFDGQGPSLAEKEAMAYEMERDPLGMTEDGLRYMNEPSIPHHSHVNSHGLPLVYGALTVGYGEEAGYLGNFIPDIESRELSWQPLPRMDTETHEEAAGADRFDAEILEESPYPHAPYDANLQQQYELDMQDSNQDQAVRKKRKLGEVDEGSYAEMIPAPEEEVAWSFDNTHVRDVGDGRGGWRVTEVESPEYLREGGTATSTYVLGRSSARQAGQQSHYQFSDTEHGEDPRLGSSLDDRQPYEDAGPSRRGPWQVTELLVPLQAGSPSVVITDTSTVSRVQPARYRFVPGQHPSASVLDDIAKLGRAPPPPAPSSVTRPQVLEREKKRSRIVGTISTTKLGQSSSSEFLLDSKTPNGAARIDSRKNNALGRQDSDIAAQIASLPRYLQPLTEISGDPPNVPKTKKSPKKAFTAPISTVNSAVSKQAWRTNTAIKNPAWYTKMLHDKSGNDAPIKILAGGRILQDRALRRSLQQKGFDLMERDENIQEADLVISASTAIIFRKLTDLLEDQKPLLSALRTAATYFKRVILVLEVINFASAGKREAAGEIDPLSPPILKAIPTFRRGIAGRCASDGKEVIGQVELVFAADGAGEVAAVLRGVVEEEMAKMRRSAASRKAANLCEQREWLQADDSPEAIDLVKLYRLNSYSSQLVLREAGSFETLAMKMTDDERVKTLGPMIGKDFIIRFNDLLRKHFETIPPSDREANAV